MPLTFRVSVCCICHSQPRVVAVVQFRSMEGVYDLFNHFVWNGSRCIEHSPLALIPRFDGYREVSR